MSNKNITKSAIADGMKVLMNMKPFDDITVSDIIKKSGVSRKTFYYHFKDKYDLVNWIFSVEIIDPLIEDTSIEHLIYCYTRLCCYIEKNETFCCNAINASGQNCFVDFLKSYVSKQVSIIGKQCDKNNILKEDDYSFLNDYYYNAFIGILKTWINNGLKEEKELVIKRWNALIYKNIEHYVYAMEKDIDLVTDSFNCVKE